MHHITLTTGHLRESPRADVAESVLPVVQDLLRRALAGVRVPVPGVPQICTLTAATIRTALLVTVWAEGGRRSPLVTVGVAVEKEDSLMLWRLLHESAVGTPLQTDARTPPPVPWCAARLEVGMALHPQPADWLGDFERCLAWGWVEMRGQEPSRG